MEGYKDKRIAEVWKMVSTELHFILTFGQLCINWFAIYSLNISVSEQSFSSKSSKKLCSKTVWENVHLPPCVICHVSRVTCHMSHVTCQSKWNVSQNGMSLQIECHSKLNVTQNGSSLQMDCHSKCNVFHNGMSLKMKCNSKYKIT